MKAEHISPEEFEREVRRVAGALWPSADGGTEIIGGTQIDAVYRTEDVTHLLECTIEKGIPKVREDINKLVAAKRTEEKTGNLARCWIVVLHDPSPHQKTEARAANVKITTFEQFKRKLIDAKQYTDLRKKYRFGSVVDPVTEKYEPKETPYYPIELVDTRTERSLSMNDVTQALKKQEIVILLGDFGTGKSLNLREIFFVLMNEVSASWVLPIAVNLRDHWAQRDGAEVLTRHARMIGFPRPDQLVRAWRAGQAILLLDGFDELAIQSWSTKPKALREVRRESVAAIADFVKNRAGCGIIIAGREQYFDSFQELVSAFALPHTARFIKVSDMKPAHAAQFVSQLGYKAELPDWIPKKPLLLVYLVKSELIREIEKVDASKGVAVAWRSIVSHIAKREAELDRSIDADSVQHVLETIATISRRTPQGEGPITSDDLRYAFRKVTGSDPEFTTMTIMLRLAGLVASNRPDGGRYFVDKEFLDTLRAGEVVRFAKDPHTYPIEGPTEWRHALGELGADVAALYAKDINLSQKALISAAHIAVKNLLAGTLGLDLICIGQRLGDEGSILDCKDLLIREASCELLNLQDYPVNNIWLDSCVINTLLLPAISPERIRIEGCLFNRNAISIRV